MIDPETNTYTNTRYMSVGGFGVGSSLTVFAGFSNINRLRAANLCPPVGIPVMLNRDPVDVVDVLVVRVCLPLFYQKSINKYGGSESHGQPDRVDHEIAFPLKNLTSYQFEMIHIVLFLAVLQSTKNHLKISRSLSPNISYPDVMIFSPG